MKKKNIILTSIAALLSVGVIGGSLALFMEKDADIEIGINGTIGTDATLKLTKQTTGTENKKLGLSNDPDVVDTMNFKYMLGADKTAAYNQDTVIGKIALDITVPDEIKDKLTYTATLGGYAGSSWGEANCKMGNADTGTSGHVKFASTKTIAFKAVDTQYIEFSIGIDKAKVTDFASFKALAEKTFSYNLTLTNDETYEYAYLVGNIEGTDWGTHNDKYRMVPQIDFVSGPEESNGGFRWGWTGDLGTGHQIKAHKGHFNLQEDNKTPAAGNIWANGDNVDTRAGKTTYLWTGNAGDALYIPE